MTMIAEKIVTSLVSNEIISAEDRQLYEYGFHQGFILMINILTTILIACLFNMIVENIIFLVAYIPLRSYAGGYHAKTPFRCYLFSVIMIAFTLLIIKLYIWNEINVIAITIVSAWIIILLGPVEDKNKPLDQIERAIFKKRTNIILCVLIVLAMLLWFAGQKQISICIIMAFNILSIMLLLGKIKNLIGGRNDV